MTELALTLACSLMLSQLDYCNAVLHRALIGSIQKLRHAQNRSSGAEMVSRSAITGTAALASGHQCTDYQLAVLTYKIHNTSTPIYLSHHITTHDLRFSFMLFLHKLTTRTLCQRRLLVDWNFCIE